MNKPSSNQPMISMLQAQTWVAQILAQIKTTEAHIMSALSDAIKTVTDGVTALSTLVTQLSTDTAAEIAALDAKITAGNVTQADLDNLKAISTSLGNAATQLQTLDTTVKNAQ